MNKCIEKFKKRHPEGCLSCSLWFKLFLRTDYSEVTE